MRRVLSPIDDELLSDASISDIGRCVNGTNLYMYSVREWKNGAKGAIVDLYELSDDVDSEGNSLFVKEGGRDLGHRDSLYFVSSEIDMVRESECYPGLSELWMRCPLVAKGIIARFVKVDLADRDYPAMFEAYYEMEKVFYAKERKMRDAYTFNVNLEDEFANGVHLRQELEKIEFSLQHLLPFLEESEHAQIISTADAYIEFVKSKATKTIEPLTGENEGNHNTDNPPTKEIVCPQGLSNIIFRETNDYGDTIDLEKFWYWIYENLVCHLSSKYEWLALLLFATAHRLLKEQATNKFCGQMLGWFGEEYTRQTCSYDQVATYQTGFFRNDKFDYVQWVSGDGKLPSNWTPNNKNQKKEGFIRIHLHCKRMENIFKFGDIIVKGPNR